MADFYAGVPNDMALQLQLLHAQLTNLKVRRRQLTEPFGILSADEFLEKVESGEIDSETATDARKTVMEINDEIEKIRQECVKVMKG